MEMKKNNAGRLRAIGYDAASRTLRVEWDDGRLLEHSPVGAEMWRRLANAGAAWSYYRDVIEEEIPGRAVSASRGQVNKNALDDLFK